MKTFKVIGMALLAIFISLNFVACSKDDNNASLPDAPLSEVSLANTTWKVVSVSNSGTDWRNFEGSTATFKSDGLLEIKPIGWSYAKWSMTDNVLKFTLGEGSPDECIVGSITFNGNKATWDCYWEDANGKWTDKYNSAAHAILSLEKQ